MKKIIFFTSCAIFLTWLYTAANVSGFNQKGLDFWNVEQAKAATTGNVNISGTILNFLALTFTSGANISFGNITPGTDSCNASGTVASVTTNAANGYALLLSDASATNSAMVHTDTTTYIPDMLIGTLANPAVWATGATTGVGVSLWTGSSALDAQWAIGGTTACSYANEYAAVPSAATTGHTVTGFHATADTSSWGWKIDVPNTQKTGMYNGNVLFTSVAVLS